MSIRPIDMQVMVPKTSEISKMQHTEMQKAGADQQQFSEQLNKQILHNQKQVVETNKSEKGIIRKDENKKKKNENEKKDKKDKDENEKKDTTKKNMSSTSIFDVKI